MCSYHDIAVFLDFHEKNVSFILQMIKEEIMIKCHKDIKLKIYQPYKNEGI